MIYLKIKVNLQIFIFVIVFILTKQIELYAWLMLFALIHEVAHMCAGIICKLKPKALHIMPFGLSVTFETYEEAKIIEIKKIIIAVAGPAINIIIAIISALINKTNEVILYTNILIAFFNLIPLYPLDGGRILKSILKINLEEKVAEKIITNISSILVITITAISSILILLWKNIGIIFVVIYLWIIVFKENKRYRFKKKIYNILEKDIDNYDIKCKNKVEVASIDDK